MVKMVISIDLPIIDGSFIDDLTWLLKMAI